MQSWLTDPIRSLHAIPITALPNLLFRQMVSILCNYSILKIPALARLKVRGKLARFRDMPYSTTRDRTWLMASSMCGAPISSVGLLIVAVHTFCTCHERRMGMPCTGSGRSTKCWCRVRSRAARLPRPLLLPRRLSRPCLSALHLLGKWIECN